MDANPMPHERRKANATDTRLYRADPRGIGGGWGACMVCGGDVSDLRNDCAFFVPSRETGEAIVGLFRQGAHLDYRPSEPGWCQVKVTACDKHLSNLEALVDAVSGTRDRLDGPGISAEMVAEFAALSQPPAVAVPEGWRAFKAACDVLTDARYFARRWSDPKAVADFIDEQMAARGITEVRKSAAPPAPSPDPLAPIRQAIADYHLELDNRKHRDVVGQRVLNAIEAALAMPWQPGAEKARRDAAQAQEGGK